MKYNKQITVNSLDMVLAEVISEDGRTVGSKFFYNSFFWGKSVESLFKKAHQWADKRIETCEKNEVKK